MEKYQKYREVYPNKTDAQIIESLAWELSDKVETIHKLLTEIESLKKPVCPNTDYVIGCDPYDKLNWWQNILKKAGFYKRRPKIGGAIFKRNTDGALVFVKHFS